MNEEKIFHILSDELFIRPVQVKAAAELLDAGNTVPFIARYRKEATGSLEDEQLRSLEERLTYLRNIAKRQEEILSKMEEQGKLTDALRAAIDKTTKLQDLEDLYLPYRQKKRTRAQMARERGLEPLANEMLLQQDTTGDILAIASKFLSDEKEFFSAKDALQGARDIVAENIMEMSDVRKAMRDYIFKNAQIVTELSNKAPEEDTQVFMMYESYSEPVCELPSHRILAINRGEKKGALKVKLSIDHAASTARILRRFVRGDSIWKGEIEAAIDDGYKRLLFPALEREIRSALTEHAEAQAIRIFGANLKQLLLQAPLAGETVMGLDPGYRNGCKMAVVDPTGAVLDYGVIQITQGENAKEAAEKKILSSIQRNGVTLLSIGNGTASYETEQFAANLIRDNQLTNVHYLITNEAGASVYSASKLAKDELGDYDVVIRGAVSIARRVQDPLAELVKIDPQAIGVGQYQHDVNQKALKETLSDTIEDAVNHVGVDLNTASPALLEHVAGLTKTTAGNIVAYRTKNGAFKSRKDLLKVSRLGPAAFTQCAGFLRIRSGDTPLDNTAIHPESYTLAEKILKKLHVTAEDLLDKDSLEDLSLKRRFYTQEKEETLAKELAAGLPTVHDILDTLVAPGRDPRDNLPAPLTRQAPVKLSDITPGTILRGTVRNITDFGAFVDIGLHQDGLIHISELAKRHVKHPLDVLSVGDTLHVMVISVDEKRNRIGLSLKRVPKEANA